MNLFFLNVALAATWGAVNGSFSPTVLGAGFVLGYLVLLVARPVLGPSAYYSGLWRALSFACFYLWELIISSVRVAIDVLNPRLDVRPGVVRLPLQVQSDTEVTMLANLISLTPGTLSLEVSADNRFLYVHAMDVDDPDELRRDLHASLEARVLRLSRPE